jgi:murein DD-endopeptidase MepM/ murein hydrolase activator NlpD
VPIFPIPFWPELDFRVGAVRFGDDRGDVLHMGSDLAAPPGTEVYAVEGGVVLPNGGMVPRPFFESGPHVFDKEKRKWVCAPDVTCIMTYEILVKHKTFIARYGEIGPHLPKGIAPNAEVSAGQVIAYVGPQTVATMLHFEMYSDVNDTSYPYVEGNMDYINLPRPRRTYHRRKDLMNPTDYLSNCILKKTWLKTVEMKALTRSRVETWIDKY